MAKYEIKAPDGSIIGCAETQVERADGTSVQVHTAEGEKWYVSILEAAEGTGATLNKIEDEVFAEIKELYEEIKADAGNEVGAAAETPTHAPSAPLEQGADMGNAGDAAASTHMATPAAAPGDAVAVETAPAPDTQPEEPKAREDAAA